MMPSELIRTARQNLRELAWLAKTSSGTRALALTGAIAEAERLLAEPDASVPDTVAALRTLVLWCHIGIDTPSRALGGLADRAEMFLTRTLGQRRVLEDHIGVDAAVTFGGSAERPVTRAQVNIGPGSLSATGDTPEAALELLVESLEMQAIHIQATIARIRGMNLSAAIVQDRLRLACQPFYACVFNDNGDITVTTTNLLERHWIALHEAVAASPDSRLRQKAKPFADCVIEGDGVFTVDPSRLDPSDWVGIDRAYREVAYG